MERAESQRGAAGMRPERTRHLSTPGSGCSRRHRNATADHPAEHRAKVQAIAVAGVFQTITDETRPSVSGYVISPGCHARIFAGPSIGSRPRSSAPSADR
jgi:hypothetical protein